MCMDQSPAHVITYSHLAASYDCKWVASRQPRKHAARQRPVWAGTDHAPCVGAQARLVSSEDADMTGVCLAWHRREARRVQVEEEHKFARRLVVQDLREPSRTS